MSKITYQSLTSVDADANGLANDVAYSGGGYALSANDAGDDLAHLITFTNNSSNDHQGKTVTFTGTDANGVPQTEALPGPDASDLITTTKFFLTLTSVTISATTGADTFDIGWTAESVGPTIIPVLQRVPVINQTIFCAKGIGSPTYGVDYTADASTDPQWLVHSTITNKSETFAGVMAFGVLGIRLHFTAAGQVSLTFVEPFQAG